MRTCNNETSFEHGESVGYLSVHDIYRKEDCLPQCGEICPFRMQLLQEGLVGGHTR